MFNKGFSRRVMAMILVFVMVFTLCDWTVFVQEVQAATTYTGTSALSSKYVKTTTSQIKLTAKNTSSGTYAKYLYSIDSPIVVKPSDLSNAINGSSSSWKKIGSAGQWSVSDGIITNSENTSNMTGFIYTNGFGLENINFSFSATSTNSDNDGIGAIFRYNESGDTCSTYFLYLNGESASKSYPGIASGIYRIDGKEFKWNNWTAIAQNDNYHWNWKDVTDDNVANAIFEKYNITVTNTTSGVHIIVSKDGQEIFNVTDTSSNQIRKGTYGFWTISQANAHFTDISVFSLLNSGTIAANTSKDFNIDVSSLSSGLHTIYFKQENYNSKGAYLGTPGEKQLKFYKNTLPIATANLSSSKIKKGSSLVVFGNLNDKEVTTSVANNYVDSAQKFRVNATITGTKYDGSSISTISRDIVSNSTSTTYSYDLKNDIANLSAGTYNIVIRPSDGSEYGASITKSFIVREAPKLVSNESNLKVATTSKSITLSGSISNYNKLSGGVYYSLDNGSNIKLANITDTTLSSNYSGTINISSLSTGQHTLKVYFQDVEGYTSNVATISLYKNTKPTIKDNSVTLSATNNSEWNGSYLLVNKGTVLSANGNVYDEDGGNIDVYYRIKKDNANGSVVISDTKLQSLTNLAAKATTAFSGNLNTSNLTYGSYYVEFFAKDNYNDVSDIANASFRINYAPIINKVGLGVNNKEQETTIRLNKGKNLYINGNVSDNEGHATTIIYTLDGGKEISLVDVENTSNGANFSGIVDTSSLSEGTHTLVIKAKDNRGQYCDKNVTLKFDINYHPTVDSLKINDKDDSSSANNSSILINRGDSFYLFGTASDKDTSDTISIEYKIDNGDYTKLSDVTNGSWNGQITTNKDISEGDHVVTVRAYDNLRGTNYDNTNKNVYVSEKTINLHINYAPILKDSYIGSSLENIDLDTVKVSLNNSIYLKGHINDEEGHDVIVRYSLENQSTKETFSGDLITVSNTSNDGNDFSTEIKTTNVPSGSYLLTISTIDSHNQEGTIKTYDVYINNVPEVNNLKLTMDSKWNGAIYKNQGAKAPVTLSFDVFDVDDTFEDSRWNDSLTYYIYINNVKISQGTIASSDLIKNNGTISLNITDLQNKLGGVSDNSKSNIKVELSDGFDVGDSSIDKDSNSKGISIRTNHNPTITKFQLDVDSMTRKNIYNQLMIGQTTMPTFNWSATDEDSSFGDYIVSYVLEYSIDGGSTWKSIDKNISGQVNSYPWLNTTSYNKKKVIFRLSAIDYFDADTKNIFGDGDNYYLQTEVAPSMPGYIIASNNSSSTYFVDKDYLFSWGQSIDSNIYDEVVKYVFGYVQGDKITDYSQMNVIYEGQNLYSDKYFNFENDIQDKTNRQVTFGVYAIDKFGKSSAIKTLTISFNKNTAPNQVDFSLSNFKDKSSTTLEDRGYLKAGESYSIEWKDAGDNDEGDKVARWVVYYRNGNNENNEWEVLSQLAINKFTLSADSLLEIMNNQNGFVQFRVVAIDTFGATSDASQTVSLEFIADVNAPVFTNENNYLVGNSNTNGQEVKFVINDESQIETIKLLYGGVDLETLYSFSSISNNFAKVSNNGKTITIPSYYLTKNGNYSLYLEDIYGNFNTVSFVISSIDLIAPTVYVIPDKTNDELTNSPFKISIRMIDNNKVDTLTIIETKNGVSKTKKINISSSNYTYSDLNVSENANYTFIVADMSGNTTTSNYNVTNIYNQKSNISSDFVDEPSFKSMSFNLYSDIDVQGRTNLGHWNIINADGDLESKTSTDGKQLSVTVYNNGSYQFQFEDIWGNLSDIYTIEVTQIFDGNISAKLNYFVPYDEYVANNSVINPNDIDAIDISSSIYTSYLSTTLGYVNPTKYVEISKDDTKNYRNVFVKATIDDEVRDIAKFINYTNNEKIDILSNSEAFFKFEDDTKAVSFFIQDVFENISVVKAYIDDLAVDEKMNIYVEYESIEPTNKTATVLVYVDKGYFFKDDTFYQYVDDNGQTKSYYDLFDWIDLDLETKEYTDIEGVPANEKDRKAFKLTVDKNVSFKVWAKTISGTYDYAIINILNIDKESPEILVKDYSTSFGYDKITVEAYTRDKFLSANELESYLIKEFPEKEQEIKEFDIANNYKVSSDGNYAYMSFTKNMTKDTMNLFKFVAIDTVGNIGYSEFINISNNLYTNNINFLAWYKDKDGNYKELNQNILNSMKTNENIEIRVSTEDYYGIFNSLNNPDSYISDNGRYVTRTITEGKKYTFVALDNYNNPVYFELDFSNVINKDVPKLTVNTTNNSDNYYTKSVDVVVSSTTIGKFIVTSNVSNSMEFENRDEITFNVTQNGIYNVYFEDEYGNFNSKQITIDNIFGEDFSPTIEISNYSLKATNKTIVVTAKVINGMFSNISLSDENNVSISYSEDGREVTFTFSENANATITATNLYGKSAIIETINVTNIDRIAPNSPSKFVSINDEGLISINFIDNGDIGFGTDKVYFEITDDNKYEYNGNVKISKTTKLKINQYLKDGLLNISYKAKDSAGNESMDVIETFESDDIKVGEFNSFYNSVISQLKDIKAIKDNTSRQEKLKEFSTNFDTIITGFEDDLDSYVNDLQKEYVSNKLNTLRILMDDSVSADEDIIRLIEGYFDRLEEDISDNGFMDELKVLIDSLDDESTRNKYNERYNYYLDLINSLFVDETDNEFSYKDSLGNIINPLSGYVLKEKLYGYYNASGEFISGKADDMTSYYLSDGTNITRDTSGNTYVDGNKNVVNVHDGLVNGTNYYDKNGNLVKVRPANGFYDFQGKWHERKGLAEIKDNSGDSGEDSGNTGGSTGGDSGNTGGSTDNPSTPEVIEPTKITLDYNTLSLKVGDVQKVTATIYPSNARETQITWTSSNTSIVRVTDGNIIGYGEGTATVTAITDNGLKAIITVTVTKVSDSNSGSSDKDESNNTTVIPPNDKYPTIDDVFNNTEDNNTNDNASYTPGKLGSIGIAYMTPNEILNSSLDKVYKDGYSTILIKGYGNVSSNIIGACNKSNMSIGIGDSTVMLILSNKDISGDVSEFSLTNSGGSVFNVSITGANSLGNNSKLIVGATSDKVLYYNGNVIASTYDSSLKGLVITNPKPGTYTIGSQGTSSYPYLNKYNFIYSKEGNLTYADLITACYNSLQKDDFNTLYSNIEVTSDVYRQASILQKYGIVDKNVNYSDSQYIPASEAYDIVYLTLSCKLAGDLNYDNSQFTSKTITLNNLNSIVKSIVEIDY